MRTSPEIRSQELVPNDILEPRSGLYEDKKRVVLQRRKVTRPVSLPMTTVSLLLAHCPGPYLGGRYSGGSHKILSEDEVT